jgi:outer membrane protein TolC
VAATGSDARPIDAVGRMAGYGGVDARAALVFSMPLGGGAARGARDAARGELLAARIREADVSAQLTVAVVRAVDDLRLARKRSEVLARSTGLAETNLATENRRFEAGGTTSFEVLKRQAELAQARLRRARAQIDRLEATARLDALTGEILARHGIALVTAD